jgi:RNA ligase
VKIDLTNIDQENFRIDPHEVAGETCYLIQPYAISAKWTKDNLHFRSSLWNSQGELVSASFKKFVNWAEQPDLYPTPKNFTSNGGCELMEKIDGSTLIVSRYKGHTIVRTRGTSDATKMDNGHEIEWLKDKYPHAFEFYGINTETDDCSYIYEWVSPENKIVLNYGEDPDLYLIAIIKHEDYSLHSQSMLDEVAKMRGLKRPARYNFASVEEMLQAVEQLKGKEGLCVYFNNGQNIRKVKSAWYLALHRMKTELGSYERVVDFYFSMNRPTYQEYYDFIVKNYDYELAEQVRGGISRICEGMKEVDTIIASMKAKVEPLKKLSRKDAAQVVLQAYGQTNRSGMAFNIMDGKELKTDDVKKLLYQVTKD